MKKTFDRVVRFGFIQLVRTITRQSQDGTRTHQ